MKYVFRQQNMKSTNILSSTNICLLGKKSTIDPNFTLATKKQHQDYWIPKDEKQNIYSIRCKSIIISKYYTESSSYNVKDGKIPSFKIRIFY